MTRHDAVAELGARTRAIAYELVRAPSVTGTGGEADFADRLVEQLRHIPYFRENPDDIALLDSHAARPGGPMTRNVVALVRGAGAATLALAGHFDVVAVDNFHDLAPLAFEPDRLAEALIADLSGRPLSAKEACALADLQSGDFVPGRGMLDMKSGLAAGIAVLERFAAAADRRGNLLLCMTPDEERNSRGMRSLRGALPALARRWGIDIVGGVNLDATSDLGDGSDGRSVHWGSVGKLLPFALVIGQPTHAGYPFEGISAHALASAVLQSVEADVELCDRGAGACSPPPVCLEAKDLRDGYDVTTPGHVWLAFNWLVHSWSPDRVLAAFTGRVAGAVEQALARLAAGAARHAAETGGPAPAAGRPATILTVADLRRRLLSTGGAAAAERIAAVAAAEAGGDDPLRRTRILVQAMAAEARLPAPAVVVGFGSLHYPPLRVDPDRPRHGDLLAAIGRARRTVEARHGVTVKDRPYFTGISDMSFFGHRPGREDGRTVADNTPLADMVDDAPAEILEFPVANIGPWGREYHQRHERLYAPYAFGVLPDLLYEAAMELLSAPAEGPQPL